MNYLNSHTEGMNQEIMEISEISEKSK